MYPSTPRAHHGVVAPKMRSCRQSCPFKISHVTWLWCKMPRNADADFSGCALKWSNGRGFWNIDHSIVTKKWSSQKGTFSFGFDFRNASSCSS